MNNNAIQSNDSEIRYMLNSQQKKIMACLPKHIDFTRFARITLNAVANSPKLLECDRGSFLNAILKAAQVGLEPDGLMGQAYLIPYGKNVQFQIGYRGYISLARQTGEISFITAEAVHENDDYNLDIFSTPRFVPNFKGDRGELIGFLAVARFKDDAFQWVFLTLTEVNEIRDKSQAWKQALRDAVKDEDGNIIKFVNKWKKEIDSVPWFHHYKEMGKKTAIKKLAKYLPQSVQKAVKVEDLQEAGINFTMQDGEIVKEMQDVTPPSDQEDKAVDEKNVLDDIEKSIAEKEEERLANYQSEQGE